MCLISARSRGGPAEPTTTLDRHSPQPSWFIRVRKPAMFIGWQAPWLLPDRCSSLAAWLRFWGTCSSSWNSEETAVIIHSTCGGALGGRPLRRFGASCRLLPPEGSAAIPDAVLGLLGASFRAL